VPLQRSGIIAHRPGSPWQNGGIESFNARLRDEFSNGQQFDTLFEAQVLLGDLRHEYNHDTTHSALRRQTPLNFAKSWKVQHQQRLAELVAKESGSFHTFQYALLSSVVAVG